MSISLNNKNPRFVLTGVNGALGGLVLKSLASHVASSDIAISTRDPSKLSHLATAGHRVLRGDYSDPSSLAESFACAHTLLLVSSNDLNGQGVAQHRTAISAAKAAGVKRIFYTSHSGARADSPFVACRDHYATEQILEESGLEYTSLRNGPYMNTIDYFTASVPYTRTIAVPRDGPASWTTREDLAEGTVKLLLSSDPLDKIVTLVNPPTADLADIARMWGEIKGGGEVKRLVVSPEEYAETLAKIGIPQARAEIFMGIFEASYKGQFKSEDPTLGRLLQGKMISVEDYLAKMP